MVELVHKKLFFMSKGLWKTPTYR